MRLLLAAAAILLSAGFGFADPLAIKVKSATVTDDINGPVIGIDFDEASARAFAALTAANIGHVVELRIDGEVVMAPFVRDAITGGSVEITGDLTLDEADDIAARLNDGSAKVEVEARAD